MRKLDPQFKELRENYEDKEHPMKELEQTALGNALGVTRQTIRGLENGLVKSISFDVLESYCNFFDVSSDYLLGFSKVPDDKPNLKMISDYTGIDVPSIELLHDYSQMDEFYIQAIYKTIEYLLDPSNSLLHAIAMYLFYPDIDGIITNDEDGKPILNSFIDKDTIHFNIKDTNHNLEFKASDFKNIVLLDNIKQELQRIKSEKEGEIYGKETNTARKRSRKRNKA